MLDRRWARVVLPAEEGPEMPSKNTEGWLFEESVEDVVMVTDHAVR